MSKACWGEMSDHGGLVLPSGSFFYHEYWAGEKVLNLISGILMKSAVKNHRENVMSLSLFLSFSSIWLFPVTFQPVQNIYSWKWRG